MALKKRSLLDGNHHFLYSQFLRALMKKLKLVQEYRYSIGNFELIQRRA